MDFSGRFVRVKKKVKLEKIICSYAPVYFTSHMPGKNS